MAGIRREANLKWESSSENVSFGNTIAGFEFIGSDFLLERHVLSKSQLCAFKLIKVRHESVESKIYFFYDSKEKSSIIDPK